MILARAEALKVPLARKAGLSEIIRESLAAAGRVRSSGKLLHPA